MFLITMMFCASCYSWMVGSALKSVLPKASHVYCARYMLCACCALQLFWYLSSHSLCAMEYGLSSELLPKEAPIMIADRLGGFC